VSDRAKSYIPIADQKPHGQIQIVCDRFVVPAAHINKSGAFDHLAVAAQFHGTADEVTPHLEISIKDIFGRLAMHEKTGLMLENSFLRLHGPDAGGFQNRQHQLEEIRLDISVGVEYGNYFASGQRQSVIESG